MVVLANLEPATLRGIESRGMLVAGEDDSSVGLLSPLETAPVGAQVLGTKDAQALPFAEFQKYKFLVSPDATALFLGVDRETRVTLSVEGKPVRVDMGLKEGTWVH